MDRPDGDDLEAKWPDVEDAIRTRQLPFFPAPLLRAPLEPGTWPPSRRLAPSQRRFPFPAFPLPVSAPLWSAWPGGRPVEEFLDLAVSLQAALVYAYRWFLEPQELEDLRSAIASEDGDLSADAAALLDLGQGHLGETRLIQVAFVHSSVGHFWWSEADWYEELALRAADVQDLAEVVEEAESHIRVDAWAQSLAESPEFQKGTNKDARRRIALRLIPDLDRIASSAGWSGRRAVSEVLTLAWEIYLARIRPEQESRIAAEARALLAEGLSKDKAAGRLGIGREKLNQLLGRYPH